MYLEVTFYSLKVFTNFDVRFISNNSIESCFISLKGIHTRKNWIAIKDNGAISCFKGKKQKQSAKYASMHVSNSLKHGHLKNIVIIEAVKNFVYVCKWVDSLKNSRICDTTEW